MIGPTPTSTLFPYTTLFRSLANVQGHVESGVVEFHQADLLAPGVPQRMVEGVDIVFHLAAIHGGRDRKSTRLNSSHANISYAVFCLKKKKPTRINDQTRSHM